VPPPLVFEVRLPPADVALLDKDQRLVTAVVCVGKKSGVERLAPYRLLALVCQRR
jgi:hypothetical protein